MARRLGGAAVEPGDFIACGRFGKWNRGPIQKVVGELDEVFFAGGVVELEGEVAQLLDGGVEGLDFAGAGGGDGIAGDKGCADADGFEVGWAFEFDAEDDAGEALDGVVVVEAVDARGNLGGVADLDGVGNVTEDEGGGGKGEGREIKVGVCDFLPAGELVGAGMFGEGDDAGGVGGEKADGMKGGSFGETELIVGDGVIGGDAGGWNGIGELAFAKIKGGDLGGLIGRGECSGGSAEDFDAFDEAVNVFGGDFKGEFASGRMGIVADGVNDFDGRGDIASAVVDWRADRSWNRSRPIRSEGVMEADPPSIGVPIIADGLNDWAVG